MLRFKEKKYIIFKIIIITILILFIKNYHYNIYDFNCWLENTFTTEMKVMWGPFSDSWNKSPPHKLKKIGSLKIGTYYPEYYKRLSNIFSDINTNDWVLTTVGMFYEDSHWESHPVFLFCNEKSVSKLENINKDKMNFILNREIDRGSIERLFKSEDRLNELFLQYVMDDSIDHNSPLLLTIYSIIDSLEMIE